MRQYGGPFQKLSTMTVDLTPIAIIHTPYKQKFAIPRQPNLVTALGEIVFNPGYKDPNMLRGLDQFSHLWLIFHFHQTAQRGWSPTVRPPRLGGDHKQGVLATRSTFRPNGLGLSVVEFDSISQQNGDLSLWVKGVDLLDGTPIMDIKPYVPWADAIPVATGGFAGEAPAQMAVYFSPQAQQQLEHWRQTYANLPQLIEQVLAQDPRPAYKAKRISEESFGMSLFDLNIRWQVIKGANWVLTIELPPQD
ncbi:MAG: tRNA-Thr(GGU) m(6)t(6)A37 methyltransferase TsaA [Paraglaciecola sp.]|jgi:tRNA-Thr(GGU) m(6)t(6)A37 methyltransferase TsaA